MYGETGRMNKERGCITKGSHLLRYDFHKENLRNELFALHVQALLYSPLANSQKACPLSTISPVTPA